MRARFVVVLLVGLMCLPLGVTSGIESNPDAVSIPSQEVQQNEHLPRVYGVDYAHEIFSSFSAPSFQDYVIEVTSNGSRHALDATEAETGNNLAARKYLIKKMNELSHDRMEVQVIGKHFNVVGKLPGYLPGDNPSFVIAGHYDSWFASHGANDGAAGIAVILELIEALSDYEWPLDIYFIAENGRYVQWGPFGTQEVANWMMVEGIDPLMVYTLEALLVQDPYAPQDERLEMVYQYMGASNFHVGQYWAELSESMSKNYGLNRINAIPNTEFDYWDFRYISQTYYTERGYMNTMVGVESAFIDDAIRTTNDVWTHPDYRYYLGAEMTGAIGASIAFTMSREYGKPVERDVNLEIAIGRTSSFYIPISAPTTINVSSRWFGGNASFSILDPDDNVVAFHEYNQASPWTTVDVLSYSVAQPGLYRLYLRNTGTSQVGMELHYSYDSDIDGNGVMDSQEYWLDSALFEQDEDGDSLSDAQEIIIGTNPESSDSDSDNLPDLWELEYGLDPLDPLDAMADADGDTLSNLQEFILGLNPVLSDSDFDLIPDDWEVQHGLNPLIDDSLEDPDDDEKSNLQEYLDGTDPFESDLELMTIPVVWYLAPSLVIVSGVIIYAWTKRRERNWTEY